MAILTPALFSAAASCGWLSSVPQIGPEGGVEACEVNESATARMARARAARRDTSTLLRRLVGPCSARTKDSLNIRGEFWLRVMAHFLLASTSYSFRELITTLRVCRDSHQRRITQVFQAIARSFSARTIRPGLYSPGPLAQPFTPRPTRPRPFAPAPPSHRQ